MKTLGENQTVNRALPKLAYDRRESATMLGISPASLDRLVQRGLLKPSRALHQPLFSVKELERFLRETSGPLNNSIAMNQGLNLPKSDTTAVSNRDRGTNISNIIFVHSLLDDFGLTPPQFRVYCHLARRAGKRGAFPAVEEYRTRLPASPADRSPSVTRPGGARAHYAGAAPRHDADLPSCAGGTMETAEEH